MYIFLIAPSDAKSFEQLFAFLDDRVKAAESHFPCPKQKYPKEDDLEKEAKELQEELQSVKDNGNFYNISMVRS